MKNLTDRQCADSHGNFRRKTPRPAGRDLALLNSAIEIRMNCLWHRTGLSRIIRTPYASNSSGSIRMTRREMSFNGVTQKAPAGSVIFFDTQASYFALRWTSPGKEGPKPGGSR
jgi:hypothetical protein